MTNGQCFSFDLTTVCKLTRYPFGQDSLRLKQRAQQARSDVHISVDYESHTTDTGLTQAASTSAKIQEPNEEADELNVTCGLPASTWTIGNPQIPCMKHSIQLFRLLRWLSPVFPDIPHDETLGMTTTFGA